MTPEQIEALLERIDRMAAALESLAKNAETLTGLTDKLAALIEASEAAERAARDL